MADTLNKKIKSTSGGGHVRLINLKYANFLFIFFEEIFLSQNGTQYIEKHKINGQIVNFRVNLKICKVGRTKWTTKCDDGYCPPEFIEQLLDYARNTPVTKNKNASFAIAKANITFMEESTNLLIDINTASHSTHMIQGLYASFN